MMGDIAMSERLTLSTGGFPNLEVASSFGSNSSDPRKGRSRRRLDGTMTGKPTRSHSADSRPQYGNRIRQSTSSDMLYLPQESRAVVTPSPLYSTRFSADFDMHELNGIHYSSKIGAASGTERGHSMDSTILQSFSTDSGGRRSRGYGGGALTASASYKEPEIGIPYNWTTNEAHRPDPTDKDYLKDSLIMFGDAYADQASVYTGLSKEELIQKKRKDQTVQKRKEKKYGKKSKNRIVNLSTSLLSTTISTQTTVPSTSLASVNSGQQSASNITQQQQSKGRTGLRSSLIRKRQKARPEKEKTNSSSKLWSIIPSLSRSRSGSPTSFHRSRLSPCSSDDLVATTASSSYESETLVGNNSFAPRPPRESPVVIQGELPTAWLQKPSNTQLFDDVDSTLHIQTTHIPKQKDFVPTSSSASATYHRKARGVDSGYPDTRNEPNLTRDTNNQVSNTVRQYLEADGKSYNEASTPQCGRVRFADYAKTKSQVDSTTSNLMKISPISVTELEGGDPTDWNEDFLQLPQPRQIDIYNNDEPPAQSATPRNPYSTAEKPKSILRRNRTARSDVSSSSVEWHCDETVSSSRSNKSVRISTTPTQEGEFLSTAPAAAGFVDENGGLISPIAMVNSESVAESDAQSAREVPTVTGVAEREGGGVISQMYEQPNLDENGFRDDDSGMISEAYSEFITAVASVVIQTAIRRFLAKTRVRRVREENVFTKRKNDALVPTTTKMREHKGAMAQQEEDMKIRLFDLAAVRIQSVFRGWMARDFAAVDHFAATIIQKSFRGFMCRTNYSYDLFRIIVSQSVARRYLALEAASHRLAYATLIQSVTRGFLVRTTLRRRQSRDAARMVRINIAAAKIQAQWRSYSCEMAYLRTYEDVVIVQTLARGWITRRLLRAWLKAHNVRQHGIRSRSGLGSSTADAPNNYYPEKIKNFNQLNNAKTKRKEFEKFGARQGNSEVLMRYKAAALGENRTFDAQKHDVASEQNGRRIAIAPSDEFEGRSSNEIVQRAALLEQEKRKKELAAVAASRKEDKLKKDSTIASRGDEEWRKEQRRKDLAIIAARHEQWRKSDADVGHQEMQGKSAVTLENNTGSGQGKISLPPEDEAEQLRKERIAYHRDPDAAASLRKERITSSLSGASAEGPGVKENASTDSTRIVNPDVSAPKESDSRLPASSAEVVPDSNHFVVPTSVSKTSKFAPIRPAKRQNPFQFDRTEEEQLRIEKIHETFRRVGLMNRSGTPLVDRKTDDIDSFAEEKSEKADVYDAEVHDAGPSAGN